MISALQSEIEKIVDPSDLIHLTHDDLVYVAKCTAQLIHERRKRNEEEISAVEKGFGYDYIFSEIAKML